MAGSARLSLRHLCHGHRFVFLLCDIEAGVAFLTGQSQVLYMKIVGEHDSFSLLRREDDISTPNSSQCKA